MGWHGRKLPPPSAVGPTRIEGMDRLTDRAVTYLRDLRLEAAHERRVLGLAAGMACAEIEPVHVELGVVIEGARRDAEVTSAA